MKIQLSRSQWEEMGKEAGWVPEELDLLSIRTIDAYINLCNKWKEEGQENQSTDNIIRMLESIKKLVVQEKTDRETEARQNKENQESEVITDQNG
jgi:hypothetical protein